jgi:methyl-accepting chemotaxis protein-2 (aspartate sensor receptor)
MYIAFLPLKSRIESFARKFADRFSDPFAVDADSSVRIGERHTPALRSGSNLLNLNFEVADHFTSQTHVTATVFVRSEDDFIRITTSVRMKDGGRAVGTLLDRSHPAYRLLLLNQSYTGYATIFGTQFMTRYDPIVDADGQVIGARYVGLDVSQMRSVPMPARIALAIGAVNAVIGVAVWASLPAGVNMVRFGVLAALSFVLVPLLGYFLVQRSIRRPLAQCREAASKIAGGDLSAQVPVDRRDDIGQLLQAMNGIGVGLAGVVVQVRQASDSIHLASAQIVAGTSDLSSRTQGQAASLEQTASAMEQLTATVTQNADHAVEADQLVASAAVLAREGGEIVEKLVSTMGEVKASSRHIEDIAGMIDTIAFQTNMLALNAAVEAARAGEHGRGFAVVATEVRGLAQRAAVAAKEIKQLITTSVDSVDAGSVLADEAGEATRKIALSIQKSALLMNHISVASSEQSKGIAEISSAVEQMDEATQSNAALVEESEAASKSLLDQVELMRRAVAIFKTADQVVFQQGSK